MRSDKKEIIGMVHLAGPDVVNKALEEIKIYEEEGLCGIIIENYHGSVQDVINTLDALVLNPTTLKVGINILPNEYDSAFALCHKYHFIEFIQLDFISGSYVGVPNIDTYDFESKLLAVSEHRSSPQVYGGVHPKYYTPVLGSDLSQDISVALLYTNTIVVTGTATGSQTPIEKIEHFAGCLNSNERLIIGAGLNPLNVREQLNLADGAIVGSAFKPNGRTHQLVDKDLVKCFMDEVKKI